MRGIQVSLTGNEREKLLDAIECYISTMGDGEATCELIEDELNNGLGSAIYKLYKGLVGQNFYLNYTKQAKNHNQKG